MRGHHAISESDPMERHLRTIPRAALLLLLAAAPAAAQEPDSVIALEPVLVRVLPSSIETGAPYPVSVVSGDQLRRGTLSTFLEEAVRAIPGVQIQNRFNLAQGERISVRGFGPRAQFGVRGVRILVDGIPATLPDGQSTLDHLDLAGLGRVEALRGPNATLYGNAAGGVLHFRTLDPALEPATVGVRWTGGTLGSSRGPAGGADVSHSMWALEARATGTAGRLGYRVGVTRTDFDGFRRNPVEDDGSTFGSGKRTNVNATASLPLGDGTLRFVAAAVDLDAENPGSLSDSLLAVGDREAYRFNVISQTAKDMRQGQLGVSWDGNLGATTAAFSGWGIGRDLWNPIPGRIVDLDRTAGGGRALFQGTFPLGPDGSFAWGAGLEAEVQNDDRLNYENNGGDAGDVELDQEERVFGSGVFVQGRLDAGDAVSVLIGGRYDRVNFEVTDNFLTGGDPDDSGDRTMSAFSPSMGVVIAAARDVELYGSLGRSFETPTTTELANRPTGAGGFNPDLEPQTGVTLEGGARATLFEALRLEGSLFRTKLENQLVPFEVPSDPGRTYFRNAGRSRHTGWEVSADWLVVPGISTRLAYTRVDAVFTDFTVDGTDYAGKNVPGLAPNRVDGLLSLTRGMVFTDLRAIWQDDIPVNDANTAQSPSYVVVDVNAGLRQTRVGGFSVEPFVGVANLFDEDYVASVIPNAFGGRYFEPGPPRTFRFGVGVNWGGGR
jgi:iron complex outermembrane receptor protein